MVSTSRQNTVIAALSGTPETGAVLKAALGIGQLTGMGVEAVHVEADGCNAKEAVAAAHANGVRVRHHHGDVVSQLLEVLASPSVFGAVVGARKFLAGPRPLGTTALEVLRSATKPVVFVPPEVAPARGFVPRRLLVPIDGSDDVSSAVLALERRFRPDADVELTVLYVLNGFTPTMVDHPEYDLPAWGEEFVRRHLPGDHRSFEWRTGDPGSAVTDVAQQCLSDLIVLCFAGNIDVGHGAVVRDALARSPIPVIVLPAAWAASSGDLAMHDVSLSAR
ncbi:MAG TPA: universal stress protein [Acidimicrobiales bacterium]|nr:universal stress protein [Acidimicrobiales bacterium]